MLLQIKFLKIEKLKKKNIFEVRKFKTSKYEDSLRLEFLSPKVATRRLLGHPSIENVVLTSEIRNGKAGTIILKLITFL